MKKLICAGLTLVLLVSLTGALASGAGTSSDPLITKEYADTVYTQSLLDAGLEAIKSALSNLNTTLDILEGNGTLVYTEGREAFVCTSRGGDVSLWMGGSFILTSGSATVTFDSGEVIDTSTGQSVASGTALKPLVRYFVTEDTLALFSAPSSALFFLDGPHTAGHDVYKQYALYEDVQGGEWFSDAVRNAYAKHFLHDWDAPLFLPKQPFTRAEMIYAIWVSAGCPETNFVSPAVDLEEEWYVPAVNWAYEQGITDGTETPDKFNPNGHLSRQEVVTMYYRWTENRGLDVSGRADLTSFPDYASIGGWAVEGASWAVSIGLIEGADNHTFQPRKDIDRSEVVTIIQRYESLM